jgi:outer membrane protein assembly factor BamB
MRTRYVLHLMGMAMAVILLLCTGGLYSCSGQPQDNSAPGQTPTGAAVTAPAPDDLSGFALPAPSQVRQHQSGVKAVSSIASRDACDFISGMNQHVTALTPEAIFSPDWADGSSPFSSVAYAMYRFELPGWGGQLTLHSTWTHAPKDYANLWLGVSNWDKDRWDWYSGAPGGSPVLKAAAMDLYKRSSSHETYVAVVLLGQGGSSLLNKVWFSGMSLRGDWWMQGHDARHTSCSRLTGPDSPALKWKLKIAEYVNYGDELEAVYFANRIAAVYDIDGVAYVVVDRSVAFLMSTMFAVQPDGTEKWKRDVAGWAAPLHTYSAALRDDGTLYWHLQWLYRWTTDGVRMWEFPEHWVVTPPVIGPEGNVYVVDSSVGFLEPDRYLHALNNDGSQLWEYYLGEGPEYLPPFSVSVTAPAVAPDGTVYVGCWDGKFYAFSADGALQWTYTAPAAIVTGSSIGDDGSVYFTTDEPKLYALSPAGGLLWSATLVAQANCAPAIANDGSLYLNCANGQLYAFSSAGAPRWPYNTGVSHSAPAIDAGGTVYVGSENNNLYAIRPDGTLKWTYPASNSIQAQPTLSEDGSICFLDLNGWFYCLGPGGV